MNKVVSINLNGFIFNIDEMAYEKLKSYIERLRRHFAGTEGAAEIISDIETRIAELLELRLKDTNSVITMEDVDQVVSLMGDPLEMEGEEEQQSRKSSAGSGQQSKPRTEKLRRDPRNNMIGGVCSGVANYLGMDPFLIRALFLVALLGFGTGILLYVILWIAIPEAKASELNEVPADKKRLFRNPENKMIGGVCSGAAIYLGIDAVWLRIAFLVSVLFFGTGILLYLVLWAIMPEARTAAEKLQMAGEPVDVSNIERKVRDAFSKSGEQVQHNAGRVVTSANRAVQMTGELLKMLLDLFGRLIGFILVLLAVCLLICLGFFIAGAESGIQSLELLRMLTESDFIYYGFVAGITLFILSFSLSMLVSGAKLLFGLRTRTKVFNAACGIIGLLSFILTVVVLIRYSATIYEKETVTRHVIRDQPAPDTLYIRSATLVPGNHSALLKSDGYYIRYYDDKGFILANTELFIKPSDNDSMSLTLKKSAHAGTSEEAFTLAKAIDFKAELQGPELFLDEAVQVARGDHFAYQYVTASLALPVGTVIRVDKPVMNMIIRSDQYYSERWDYGELFVVTNKGLKCLECEDDDDRHGRGKNRHEKDDKGDDHIEIRIGEDDEQAGTGDAKENDDRVSITIGDDGDNDGIRKTEVKVEDNKDGTVSETEVTKVGPVTITKEKKNKRRIEK